MAALASGFSLAEKMVFLLRRLGWEEKAISRTFQRSLRHQGIAVKLLNLIVSLKDTPYLLITIPQNLRLANLAKFQQRSMDMDEILRLIISYFYQAYPLFLILTYDGHTGYLYSLPEELLLAHCDSTKAFEEKMLSLLRPELAYNPDFFREQQVQRALALAKELQQWLRRWQIKLGGISNLNKEVVISFTNKLLLWRLAAETETNERARKKLRRYIFPEENFKKKKAKMPDARKDILQIFKSLAEENNLEYCQIKPDDLLLLRRLGEGKFLRRLLWELNLLSRHKLSPEILGKYADLTLTTTSSTPPSSVEKKEQDATKKYDRPGYIIDAPTPRYIDLDATNFETLVKEMEAAFKEILMFRVQVISESRKVKNKIFVQEDLFFQQRQLYYASEDILKVLVTNGIRVRTKDEQTKDYARFITTASMMELRYNYQLPLIKLPFLAPIFTAGI